MRKKKEKALLNAMYGERFKQVRLEHGWKQSSLGTDLDLLQGCISKWETGKQALSFHTVVSLSRVFKCSLYDFLPVKKVKKSGD